MYIFLFTIRYIALDTPVQHHFISNYIHFVERIDAAVNAKSK